jgi:hypothetical protein
MTKHKDMCSLAFCAQSTGQGLRLQVRFDGLVIHDSLLVSGPVEIQHEFEEFDGQAHVLELEMSGKSVDHTVIDADGNIVADQVIEITNMSLLGNKLGHLFVEHSTYTHDFNGSGDTTQQEFYTTMGCNGVVKFKFTSPVYLWLLENM